MSFVRNACLFAFTCVFWGCTSAPTQDVATEVPDSTEETVTTTTTEVTEPDTSAPDTSASEDSTDDESDVEDSDDTTTTSPATTTPDTTTTTSTTTTTTTTTSTVADQEDDFTGGLIELPLEGSAGLGAQETIRFASVVEDSRCPTDANCIQAGTLIIQVVYEGSAPGVGCCGTRRARRPGWSLCRGAGFRTRAADDFPVGRRVTWPKPWASISERRLVRDGV